MTKSKRDRNELIHGSGNVWRDLGFADADIRQAKGILAAEIVGILDDRKLSVRKAQERTGFAAADFSRVRNADYRRFTLDRMIKMLTALDAEAEVTVDVRRREASRAA
jgi:predicted XRE-type DNA-binding protein